jgi:hypothetical protein
MKKSYPQVGTAISKEKVLSKESEAALKAGIEAFKKTPAGAPAA